MWLDEFLETVAGSAPRSISLWLLPQTKGDEFDAGIRVREKM